MVTKFQSVKLADDVDFDARQVEADVKVAPVEEEPKPREERPSASATRAVRAPRPATAGRSKPWHVLTWVVPRVRSAVASAAAASAAAASVAVAAAVAAAVVAVAAVAAAAVGGGDRE